jgi:hypothetical protein
MALKQYETINIFCADEQKPLPAVYYNEKITRYGMNLDKMEQIIRIGKPPDLSRIPFTDSNGNGIHLGERKAYA